MASQILSALGNYIGANLFALLLVLAVAKWPRLARLLVSVLFVGAGVWNLSVSLTMPAFYVVTYGPLATPAYQSFIYGAFAARPALFVVPIAVGELAIGILAAGSGTWVRLSMVGMIGFMMGLAPLGVGAAFPFSLFAIVAAYLLSRKRFETSLFDDVGAALPRLLHVSRPHAHARR